MVKNSSNNVYMEINKNIQVNTKKRGKSFGRRNNNKTSLNMTNSFLVTEELLNMDTINEEVYIDNPNHNTKHISAMSDVFRNNNLNNSSIERLNEHNKKIKVTQGDILTKSPYSTNVKIEKQSSYGESLYSMNLRPGTKTQERIDRFDNQNLVSSEINAWKNANAQLDSMERKLSNSPNKRK